MKEELDWNLIDLSLDQLEDYLTGKSKPTEKYGSDPISDLS